MDPAPDIREFSKGPDCDPALKGGKNKGDTFIKGSKTLGPT